MQFEPGQIAHHAKFGAGKVVLSEGNKVTVLFKTAGERRVLSDFLAASADKAAERYSSRMNGHSSPMTAPLHDPAAIVATPYVWTQPETIAPRDWLYGYTVLRSFLSATVAAGGVGKSSLIAAEALAMVSGRDLLGVAPKRKLRVWLWNLEDPHVETARKIQATAKLYGLEPGDIGDRLFVDSGRDQRLVIAKASRTGVLIVQPVVDSLVAEIKRREIDVVIVDPFVSSHEVGENDNTAIDMVAKEWGRVIDRGDCAGHPIHHIRKGEQEVTTESARGGKALTDACRVVRVINRMSKEDGEKAGVANHRLYFRTINDKTNLAPSVDQSDWYELRGVELGNGHLGLGGDNVGVVKRWKWPDPTEGMTGADFEKAARAIRAGRWRESSQAKNWVGRAVADALGFDLDKKPDKARVAGLVRIWRETGALVVVDGEDEKRMPRKFVEVAPEP